MFPLSALYCDSRTNGNSTPGWFYEGFKAVIGPFLSESYYTPLYAVERRQTMNSANKKSRRGPLCFSRMRRQSVPFRKTLMTGAESLTAWCWSGTEVGSALASRQLCASNAEPVSSAHEEQIKSFQAARRRRRSSASLSAGVPPLLHPPPRSWFKRHRLTSLCPCRAGGRCVCVCVRGPWPVWSDKLEFNWLWWASGGHIGRRMDAKQRRCPFFLPRLRPHPTSSSRCRDGEPAQTDGGRHLSLWAAANVRLSSPFFKLWVMWVSSLCETAATLSGLKKWLFTGKKSNGGE